MFFILDKYSEEKLGKQPTRKWTWIQGLTTVNPGGVKSVETSGFEHLAQVKHKHVKFLLI